MTSVLLLAMFGCAGDKDLIETGLVEEEVCDDGADNDGDGDSDCEDADCASEPACQEVAVEDCSDGVDNDEDGEVDCDDADCADDAACASIDEVCDDDIDNDEDGDVDCDDTDCADDPACQATDEDCSDGEDNDLDGLIDCLDVDCEFECPEDCTDGLDNDADGLIDCLDIECFGSEACVEDCSDGTDNDGNGLVDCEDAACADDPACTEDCEDGSDNDLDGFVDCDDDDCWGTPECIPEGAKVISHGGGTGSFHQLERLYSYYSPEGRSSFGYSSSFTNSALFKNIQGTVRTTVEGSEVACGWTVDSVLMGRSGSGGSSSYVYQYAFGLDLVARSGFKTSGACGGLDSDFLPTKFAIASYSGIGATDTDVVVPYSFTGPLWYAAAMSNTYTRFSSSGGGLIPGGGSSFYFSSGVDATLAWPAGGSGDVWNP